MKKVVSITRLVLNSIFFLGGIALILLGTGALDGLVKNPVISLKDDTIGTYIKVHYGIGDISFSKPEIILGILISLLSLYRHVYQHLHDLRCPAAEETGPPAGCHVEESGYDREDLRGMQ